LQKEKECLLKSIALDDSYLDSFVNLAIALEKEGDKNGALKNWKKAADLAITYRDEKATKEALENLERLGLDEEEL
jgi:Tfp pilus assembly protein PilF